MNHLRASSRATARRFAACCGIFFIACALPYCSSGGQKDPDPEQTPDLSTRDSGVVDASPLDLALPPAEGKGLWGHSYQAEFSAVAVDVKSGAVYVGGSFVTADFGDGKVTANGLTDAVLLKFDRAGKREWARTFGQPFFDSITALAVTPDGGVAITGATLPDARTDSHDVFVARYDAAGTQRAFRVYASTKIDVGKGIAVAADGSLYIGGSIGGDINFGGGPLGVPTKSDGFLVHQKDDGTHLFSKRFAGTQYGYASAVVMAQGGDVLLAGQAPVDADFGDKPTGTDVESHAFLARFTAAGALRWVKRLGPCSARCVSSATALRLAKNGDAVIGGYYGGPVNLGGGQIDPTPGSMFAARYGADGRFVAQRVMPPSAGAGFLNALDIDADDQLIIGGQVEGDFDFGGGISQGTEGCALVAKLTFDKRQRWVRRIGGPSSNAVNALALDSDGSMIFVGFRLDRPVTLDAAVLTLPGFIVRLSR
jgi:hypothetical protein